MNYLNQSLFSKTLIMGLLSFVAWQQSGNAEYPLIAPESTSKKYHAKDEINFGVLTDSKDFQIYRSAGLGARGLVVLDQHLAEQGLDRPSKIIYLNSVGYPARSLWSLPTTTKEGAKSLFYFAKEWITSSPYFAVGLFAHEEATLASAPTSPFRFDFVDGSTKNVYLSGDHPLNDPLPLQEFFTPEGEKEFRTGNRSAFYQILHEILTNEGPVLFHCQGGIHRTGMTALMIRYLQGEHWTDTSAFDHFEKSFPFKRYGILPEETAVLSNLAEYEYFQHNPLDFKQENLKAVELLAQDERFQCLKREFSSYLNSPRTQSSRTLPEIAPSLDKNKAWEKCDRFAIETQVAGKIDELYGKTKSGRLSANETAEVKDQIELVLEMISKTELPLPVQEGDAMALDRIHHGLKNRLQALQARLEK